MKKLIYEVYDSKREGGLPFVNIYSDGSFEIPKNWCKYPDPDPQLDKARLLTTDFYNRLLEMARYDAEHNCGNWFDDWFGNPRYSEAYFTLKILTQRLHPFPGYRIVYHGEGKPWKRVADEGTKF